MSAPRPTRRWLLLALPAALAAPRAMADEVYVYYDPRLGKMVEFGDKPKELVVTPESTTVTTTSGDRFDPLLPPEVSNTDQVADLDFDVEPGLPAPLGIDGVGSVFDTSGGTQPIQPGTYTFSFVVTDKDGYKGKSVPVTLVVLPPPESSPPPTLPVGPCGQILC